ncbi:MAG: hypothetical protein HN564_04730 [Flavobacteriales bacterium]|jgi:thymidylate kinase|nr:hypothetical protein [Flavobacteriaceae bacterium]MBT7896282.1 hypothetical protein [Flavobacteriales bacterium]
METDLIASDLIKQFFNLLNTKRIRYAVMRNYELLPEANDSKDIDVLVSPNAITNVVVLLKETAANNGYQLIWKNKLDYLEGFVFVKIDNDKVYSIKFDIFNGFKWRGCNYLDHNIILDSTLVYNGFNVPHKAHESIIMIIYYVLYAKKIKRKYLEPIYNNANDNIEEFKRVNYVLFKKNIADNIIKLVQENKIEYLVTLRRRLIVEILKKNFRNESILKNFFKHIKVEFYDRRRLGTMLAFSGPDGAGKSTIIDVVMELFFSLGITKSTVPHHFLTSNIPSLHKLPGAPTKYAKQDYTKPYQTEPTGLLSSIIRTVYYYMAFLIDRVFFISKEMRSNQIVVFDRYYTDMITDPSRIRISFKKTTIQRIFKTLPSPNFTFVVVANKELILNRKDELSEEKLIELLAEYKNLFKFIPNLSVLSNNESIEVGQLMTCKNIFNCLEKRYN